MTGLGRPLIILGLILVAIGVLITVSGRLPFKIGRLPGDMVWRGKYTTFYFPLMTSVLLSLLLTLVMWLLRRRG
jgi:hypothetical protein